ncbi:MAG: PEP/pyruvate-binding domain-containing protein, partial [Clostridiales Family XIII bacterium]|nr:PEP/pyruvate-binding domain-containing protein [Clostridiales Family XIII bacterium]
EPKLATRADRGVNIYDIDISTGFEQTVIQVTDIIENEGAGTHYVFDSLTDLQDEWIADFMMTNFFVVTVPEIVRSNSVAYFSFMRGRHSTETVSRIRETTSILIDVVHRGRNMYVHPAKVLERYLPTIFLPHVVNIDDPDSLSPITNGIGLAEYFALVGHNGDIDMTRSLDNWERFFMDKRQQAVVGVDSKEEIRDLCRITFTPDERILDIVERNITLDDILSIKSRMIGVGSVGGKATGMLLSRLIVERQLPDVAAILEPHDSYYICSNLYYTFLVKNKCWSLKIRQRKQRGYFGIAEILKEKILEGTFSDNIREQFRQMLEYFGQSPIIVRSSSMLEDGFGNAFAGKYESVFCVNKGTLEERLQGFEDAVRTVYASTMDESALEYRLKRGLAPRDEQMALLVQRVSGSLFQDIYMPAAAGVCFSYNSYRWNKDIDPGAGVIRIVLGLGTRAVDRTEGDYPRLAALDQPKSRAMKGEYDSDFTQKKVDVLDLTLNTFATIPIEEAERRMKQWFREVMIERDYRKERELKKVGLNRRIVYTSCERILENENIIADVRAIIKAVEHEYDCPVDVEFAINISVDGHYMINLLQCRPLYVGGIGIKAFIPEVPDEETFFRLSGGTMGGAYYSDIDVVVQINPRRYYEYPYNLKPAVARLVGQVNHYYKDSGKVIMLLVPGRLGTTSPELGVPVKFAEISNMNITCEVSYEGAGYLPELSYGSHFFQDLVEADIFYAAIFEGKGTTEYYSAGFFEEDENILSVIAPDVSAAMEDIVSVFDVSGKKLKMVSEIESGRTVCGYFIPLGEDGEILATERSALNRLNV